MTARASSLAPRQRAGADAPCPGRRAARNGCRSTGRSIGDEEIAEVVDTLRSGWLTTGPKTRGFEQKFAARLGVPRRARALVRHRRAAPRAPRARRAARRRRRSCPHYTFTATAEVVTLPRRAAGPRRRRPGDVQPARRGRRAVLHAEARAPSCRCTSPGCRATWSRSCDFARARGIARPRGRGARAAGARPRPLGRHARRRRRVQLLRHQEHHDGRGRHARAARPGGGGAGAHPRAARHQPRRVEALHGRRDVALRDPRERLQVQPDRPRVEPRARAAREARGLPRAAPAARGALRPRRLRGLDAIETPPHARRHASTPGTST